jgi:hypothetical protein
MRRKPLIRATGMNAVAVVPEFLAERGISLPGMNSVLIVYPNDATPAEVTEIVRAAYAKES